jgi:hypothetical protein
MEIESNNLFEKLNRKLGRTDLWRGILFKIYRATHVDGYKVFIIKLNNNKVHPYICVRKEK